MKQLMRKLKIWYYRKRWSKYLGKSITHFQDDKQFWYYADRFDFYMDRYISCLTEL